MQSATIKAVRKDQNVHVDWNVANELNTEIYEVEKSLDGRQFSKVGSVSKLPSNTAANYLWIDNNATSSNIYYRIKGLDVRGSSKYSAIVKVQSIAGKARIVAYPNPIQGKVLNLQFSQQPQSNFVIQMYNAAGQEIFNKVISHTGGSATYTLSLGEGMRKGAYDLKISNGEQTTTQKIICN